MVAVTRSATRTRTSGNALMRLPPNVRNLVMARLLPRNAIRLAATSRAQRTNAGRKDRGVFKKSAAAKKAALDKVMDRAARNVAAAMTRTIATFRKTSRGIIEVPGSVSGQIDVIVTSVGNQLFVNFATHGDIISLKVFHFKREAGHYQLVPVGTGGWKFFQHVSPPMRWFMRAVTDRALKMYRANPVALW